MKKDKKNTKSYRIPKYSAGGQVALELAPLATSLISNKLNNGEVPTDGSNMLNYGGQGAAFGAQIGTSIGVPLGTGIGAGVGAIAGAGYGLYSANKQQKAKRQADNINTANQQYSDVYGAQNPDMYQAPVYADGGVVVAYRDSKGGLDRRLGAKYALGGQVNAPLIEVEAGEIVADGDNITHIGKTPHAEGGDKLPVYNKGFKRNKDKPYAIAGGTVYSTQYSDEERQNIANNMKKVKFPISKGSKDRAQKTLDYMAALEGPSEQQFAEGGAIPVYYGKGGLDRRLGAKYDGGGYINRYMRSPLNTADTREINVNNTSVPGPYSTKNSVVYPTTTIETPNKYMGGAGGAGFYNDINLNTQENMAYEEALPGKGPVSSTPYPVRAPYINPPEAPDLNFPPLSNESVEKHKKHVAGYENIKSKYPNFYTEKDRPFMGPTPKRMLALQKLASGGAENMANSWTDLYDTRENPGTYTRRKDDMLDEYSAPRKEYNSALAMGWNNAPVNINENPAVPNNAFLNQYLDWKNSNSNVQLDQNGNPVSTEQGGKYSGGPEDGKTGMGTNSPAAAGQTGEVPNANEFVDTGSRYGMGNVSKYLAPAYNMFMGSTKPEYAEMGKFTPNLLTNPERALMPNRLRDSRAAYSSTKNSLVGNMTAGQRNASMLMAGNNYNRANQDIYGKFAASELDIANKNNMMINDANKSNMQVDYMNADNRLKAKSAGRAMIGEGLSQFGEIGQMNEKNENQLAVDELRSLLYSGSIPPNSEAAKRVEKLIQTKLSKPKKKK